MLETVKKRQYSIRRSLTVTPTAICNEDQSLHSDLLRMPRCVRAGETVRARQEGTNDVRDVIARQRARRRRRQECKQTSTEYSAQQRPEDDVRGARIELCSRPGGHQDRYNGYHAARDLEQSSLFVRVP